MNDDEFGVEYAVSSLLEHDGPIEVRTLPDNGKPATVLTLSHEAAFHLACALGEAAKCGKVVSE